MRNTQPQSAGSSLRWYHTHSLRRRLLTLLGSIFLLTLIVIGTSMFYFIYENEQQLWRGRLNEAALNSGETVTAFMARMQDTQHLAGALPARLVTADPQLMSPLLEQNPALLELIRLDAQGDLLASSYQDAPLLTSSFTIPQSSWFIQAKAGQLYLGGVQISADSEPYLIMATPTPDGGVVAARLRMNVLWEVVANLNFGQTGQSYIINSEGEILAHTDPTFALNRTRLKEGTKPAARLAGQNRSNAYTNFQGTEVIGETGPVLGTDWEVFTEVSQSEAFAASRTALLLLSSGLALVGILVILVTALFLRKLIIQPMEQLRAGALRIGQGDFDYQLDVGRDQQDEVSQVAATFNEMISHLKDRDAQIIDRTAKLRKTNDQLQQEIVERKHAESALRESEARFRQVVSSISDHIYMTEITPDGRYINRYISPNVTDLTGYPPQKIEADWNFWSSTLIHPDDRAIVDTQTKRFAQSLNSETEYRLIRADGDIIWVRDSGRVEKEAASQSILVYSVVSDITERKQTEEALAVARDQALEASRLKSQLLAKVSHELRTPLGAILGYTQLLHQGVFGPMSEPQTKATTEIIDSTDFLTNMVNELLDQAQLETGKLKLNISSVNLIDSVNQVESKMRVLAQAKGLSLTTDIAADVPPLVSGDQHRLQQVLVNLTGNAIKFTETGQVEIRLFCPDSDHWAMQVSDTGPGIPSEAQTYIFESFRQVDGSETRAHGGSGLGLSIVKQLTTMMGGHITLHSEVGQGSTFTILLPLVPIREKTI